MVGGGGNKINIVVVVHSFTIRESVLKQKVDVRSLWRRYRDEMGSMKGRCGVDVGSMLGPCKVYVVSM